MTVWLTHRVTAMGGKCGDQAVVPLRRRRVVSEDDQDPGAGHPEGSRLGDGGDPEVVRLLRAQARAGKPDIVKVADLIAIV